MTRPGAVNLAEMQAVGRVLGETRRELRDELRGLRERIVQLEARAGIPGKQRLRGPPAGSRDFSFVTKDAMP